MCKRRLKGDGVSGVLEYRSCGMIIATRWMRVIPACFTLLLQMLQPALCQSYVLSLSPVHPVVEYRFRASSAQARRIPRSHLSSTCRISDVAFSGVSCEGYFLAGQAVDLMLPYDLILSGACAAASLSPFT